MTTGESPKSGGGRGKITLPGTPEQWKEVGRVIRAARLAMGWTSAETLTAHLPPGSPRVAQVRNYENGHRPQYATTLGVFETVLRIPRGTLGAIVGIPTEECYATLHVPTSIRNAAQRREDLSRIAALERQVGEQAEQIEAISRALAMIVAALPGGATQSTEDNTILVIPNRRPVTKA